jgi:transcriptional regulator with XRE-family HTH domain
MEKPGFLKTEQKKNYEYFKHAEQRNDIYQFSKELSNYLHNEKIPNMIMLDRSPRPLWVGIDEYWKIHYKNEPRPNIYFINPDGFDSITRAKQQNNLSQKEIFLDHMMFASTGESIIINKAKEIEENTRVQFEQAYSKLEKNKTEPLVVFDNCLHSGRTIIPVIHYLKKYGYEDLRIVIGETSSNRSNIRVDKDFTDKVKFISCRAFGGDFGVQKDDENVYSSYDENADRSKVISSREEIRRIVREQGV